MLVKEVSGKLTSHECGGRQPQVSPSIQNEPQPESPPRFMRWTASRIEINRTPSVIQKSRHPIVIGLTQGGKADHQEQNGITIVLGWKRIRLMALSLRIKMIF